MLRFAQLLFANYRHDTVLMLSIKNNDEDIKEIIISF